jgi:hypothetical protein
MRLTSRLVAAFFALSAAGLIGGCQSDPRMSETGKAVESFSKTKAAVGKAEGQVDQVLASLSAVSSSKNLVPDTKTFNAQVEELRYTAEAAKKRAEAMKESQDAFVQKWQEEMSTINDPALKSTLEQRRDAVRTHFNRVKSAGQSVRDAYTPFMDRLTEIQKALSIDLTPQTVTSIRPVTDRAQSDGQMLKQKLQALQAELDAIQAGLSPKS